MGNFSHIKFEGPIVYYDNKIWIDLKHHLLVALSLNFTTLQKKPLHQECF